LGGWSQVISLQGKREPVEHDTRILGSGDFVGEIMREAEKRMTRYLRTGEKEELIDRQIKKICLEEGIGEQELRMGGRARKISRVRAKNSCFLVKEYGLSRAGIARHLGVSTSAIARMVQKKEIARKC
jgi:hypothetical protein